MMTQDIFGFRNPAAGPLSESSAGFLPQPAAPAVSQ
jgi:hypothetical protein